MPMRLLKIARLGLLLGLGFTLGGCAKEAPNLLCPQPLIIRELSRQYQHDARTDAVSTRTSLERVSDYKCALKKGVFTSEVSLWLSAERKMISQEPQTVPVTYFLSILSPEGTVLSKTEQTALLSFSGTKQLYTKQHVVLDADPLVLNKGQDPEKLCLRVGLQFSPEAFEVHKKSFADQERHFYNEPSSSEGKQK